MSVGTLFAVFGLLAGRTRTVCSRYVFLFLGFGLNLVFFRGAFRGSSEYDAAARDNIVYTVVHVVYVKMMGNVNGINDGTNALR